MPCLVCHRPESLCLCASMPRIAVATRVVLLADHREVRKATNTGLLACRALVGSEMHVSGMLGETLDWERIPSGLVLFPAASAEVLTRAHAGENLIVPDGDWGQASRLARKLVQRGKPFRFVKLPSGTSGRCNLRRPPKNLHGVLSTIEAIARALAILEGPTPADALEALLDDFLARHAARSGKRPAGDVSRSRVDAHR